MNFLTPLYLLGALAIVAPIVFHLIRQTPKGEIPFSSIMFLEPSPPRVTQRSRIDHWLLLLLRAGVLALLALAFARPFWRAVAQIDLGDSERRRILVLIDTSASMKRGDLWAEAQKKAVAAITAARPDDPLAIFAFDATPRTLMSFAEAAALEPPARLALARNRVQSLAPSWKGTELGAALAESVAAIADGAAKDSKAGRIPRRVVLVSDLQEGSKLEALGNLAWPSDVELELQTVKIPVGNAGIEALADALEGEAAATRTKPAGDGPAARVRITSEAGNKVEAFRVGWVAPRGQEVGASITTHVPAGESRVVRVPVLATDPKLSPGNETPTTLRLLTDPFPFDNFAYIAAVPKTEDTVEFWGGDTPDDPNGLLYYLNRVFDSNSQRVVHVLANPTMPDLKSSPDLIVVTTDLEPDRSLAIRQQVEAGTSALVVATKAGPSPTLATLLGVPTVEWIEAPSDRDAMLGEIAFDHPTFAPLAGSQFRDFTKIRFWKRRTVADPAQIFKDAQILAKFDDGTPALVEKPVGKGRVLVLVSGWSPGDSQLARSSKFVPLMTSLLDRRGAATGDPKRYRVGDRVVLTDLGFPSNAGPVEIHQPDGSKATLEPGTEVFAATDEPGIYSVRMRHLEGGPLGPLPSTSTRARPGPHPWRPRPCNNLASSLRATPPGSGSTPRRSGRCRPPNSKVGKNCGGGWFWGRSSS